VRAVLLVTFVAGCGADGTGAHLELPAAPACDVPLVPWTIYDSRACGGALIVDDARLTWIETAGPTIYGAPKCGGEATPLSTRFYAAIARDASGLYAIDNAFWRIPDDGSGPVALATGFVDPRALALEPGHDTALVAAHGFCTSFAGPNCQEQRSLLWRINRAGSVPVPLLPAQPTGVIYSLAVGAGSIYFDGEIGGAVGLFRVGSDGSGLERIGAAGTTNEIGPLAVDPVTDEVFARDLSGVVAVHGDDVTTVFAAGNGYIQSFAIDAHFVYAVFDDGHLGRAPRGGGDETVLLAGSRVTSVGLDDAAVYAFDCADPGGRIVMFAR
jgi:hypothetical protein